jgi:hypothetical protein
MSGFCRTKHHTHVRHTSTEVWNTTLIKKFLLLTTMTYYDQNFIQFFTTMSPPRPVKKNTHGFIRFSLFFALKTAGFFLPRQDTLKLSRYNIIRYNDHMFNGYKTPSGISRCTLSVYVLDAVEQKPREKHRKTICSFQYEEEKKPYKTVYFFNRTLRLLI